MLFDFLIGIRKHSIMTFICEICNKDYVMSLHNLYRRASYNNRTICKECCKKEADKRTGLSRKSFIEVKNKIHLICLICNEEFIDCQHNLSRRVVYTNLTVCRKCFLKKLNRGASMLGRKMTIEHKINTGIASKKRWLDLDFINKMKVIHENYEYIEKLSEIHKGKKDSEATKYKKVLYLNRFGKTLFIEKKC